MWPHINNELWLVYICSTCILCALDMESQMFQNKNHFWGGAMQKKWGAT